MNIVVFFYKKVMNRPETRKVEVNYCTLVGLDLDQLMFRLIYGGQFFYFW